MSVTKVIPWIHELMALAKKKKKKHLTLIEYQAHARYIAFYID